MRLSPATVERAVERAARDPAAQGDRGRSLARFRRDHPGARSWTMPLPLVDRIAPEHLEIATADAERLAAQVRNAGAIFLGAHTPEAIGDYIAGSNHVLPTARSARFSSGLGVLDFMKRTSILKCEPGPARALGARRDHARRGRRARRACPLHRGPAESPMTRATEHRISTPRRDHARRGLARAPHARGRAGTRSRDLRSARRTTASRPRATTAGRIALHPRHCGQPAGVRHPPRRRHAGASAHHAVAHAVPPHREGLFPGLRQLLQGDPHRARPIADRGARHGPPRAARRRLACCCRNGSRARSKSISTPRGACSR